MRVSGVQTLASEGLKIAFALSGTFGTSDWKNQWQWRASPVFSVCDEVVPRLAEVLLDDLDLFVSDTTGRSVGAGPCGILCLGLGDGLARARCV